MRLNVKDLRIANLLEHNGDIREISTLHDDNTLRFKDGNSSIGCFKATIDTIKPIPLTEEILLNNNFEVGFNSDPQEPNASKVYRIKGLELFQIDEDKNVFVVALCSSKEVYNIYINYVHELQNLFKELKKEELIINLK